jgi:hypothetical protein
VRTKSCRRPSFCLKSRTARNSIMSRDKGIKNKKISRGGKKNLSATVVIELLRSISRSHWPPQKPSLAATLRLKTIPVLFSKDMARRIVKGVIISDSWASAPALALRDVADGHIRRLELKSNKVSLEIVAERTRQNWEYTARVYSRNAVENGYVLNAGGVRLLPLSDGFYHWSSSRVPRTIKLISFNNIVVFERVVW